MLFAYKTDIQA